MHAEALLHGVLPAHAAASGKALLAFSPPGVVNRVIAAGLPAFTRHTITSPDVLRQRLSAIRLTQIATSRNEFECGKAAIAMPIFYGAGSVAAAIELTVRDLGNELKPAAGALSVACRSLSRQLANEGKPKRSHHPQSGVRAGLTPPIRMNVAATQEVLLWRRKGVSRTFLALFDQFPTYRLYPTVRLLTRRLVGAWPQRSGVSARAPLGGKAS